MAPWLKGKTVFFKRKTLHWHPNIHAIMIVPMVAFGPDFKWISLVSECGRFTEYVGDMSVLKTDRKLVEYSSDIDILIKANFSHRV